MGVAFAATGWGEEWRGWRGKERVAETRKVGDGDVLILSVSYYVSGTCVKNTTTVSLIFQRGEGRCCSAHNDFVCLGISTTSFLLGFPSLNGRPKA